MSTINAYPQLVEGLNDVRRRWRGQKVVEGILLVLAGAAVVLVMAIVFDNLLHLSTPGRLLVAVVLWGALATGIISLVVKRLLEDRRDDFFAALVEEKHPELHNQLINALQLGRGQANGFSPRLIEAIVNDAAEATADIDMIGSLNTQSAKRAGLFALAGIFLLVLYAAVFTPRFANGLARVFLPLADIPPYTATHILEESIKPGSRRVPEGVAVPIAVKVSGTVPLTAQLLRKSGDNNWQSFTMQADPNNPDQFRFTVPQANESFDYYVMAGDARSSLFSLEVVKRPQIESLRVTYAPPAYTVLPARPPVDSDGQIAGLAGTKVNVELRATKPLEEAAFVIEGGEKIALERGADDQTWSTAFIIWGRTAKADQAVTGRLISAPARYQVKLSDVERYENADPLWHTISLLVDKPPTVTISAPGRDLQSRPDATVDLAVDTKDDFGIGDVQLFYRVNEEQVARELHRFVHDGAPEKQSHDVFKWSLAQFKFKGDDVLQYWATAVDRNNITGPGKGESRRFSIYVVTPEKAVANLDLQIQDYAQELEELVRLQRENRAQTASGIAFVPLVKRQTTIRTKTNSLARAMEKDALPVGTIVKSLDELHAGLMATAVKLLESGGDTNDAARSSDLRSQSMPVQDKIIAELEALLARLQRNEQAKKALRKIEKKDKNSHKEITKALSQMVNDLDRLLKDQSELAAKFEKMPKKSGDELKEEKLKGMKDLEEFQKKWEKWAKGKVNELTKLPTGFIDDFNPRPDVNKIFEEIEKSATKPKAEKMEVGLEDLGAGLATKMKEDLEMWMPDTPDAAKWVLEEPLDKKPMKIPEMPLPKALEDMVGDLLQKADEFDEDADDVTSAWGDNLDQAGWGVSDGPISTFSAKGKTGNDLPNNMELNGRSGEGRRGKSSGQMVGDTVKGLQGRKTPARVGNERYEPGQLKNEGQQDPNGATGGGKKAGGGRKGLQGGTPPDLVRDIGRLSAKQAGLREKAEQVAHKLDTVGIHSPRLTQSIQLMKSAEKDLRDLRYDDASRKRREALHKLHSAFEADSSTAVQLSRARDLPPQLRTELLQAADEGYPPGYESLLKNYFKALSAAEK